MLFIRHAAGAPPHACGPRKRLRAPAWKAATVVADDWVLGGTVVMAAVAEVASMATAAVKGVFDPGFEGSLTKAVVSSNSPKIVGREDEVRAHLMKEVSARRMWGPFKYCPFKHARIVKLSMAPKFKWEPARKEFRLISDLSQYGTSSVNDLCMSPEWVSFHLMGSHLRDLIDENVDCYVFTVDVPKCFRRQSTWRKLLPLFTYCLTSPSSGKEYFTDLCNTFGFRPSEYVWQAILAVILWQFWQEHAAYDFSIVQCYLWPNTGCQGGLTKLRRPSSSTGHRPK